MKLNKLNLILLICLILSSVPIFSGASTEEATADKSSATAPQTTPQLTIDDFVSPADFIDAEVSPNGQHLAMIWQEEDRRLLVIKDLKAPGMPTTGVISEKVIRPTSVFWANNERLLVNVAVPYGTKSAIRRANEDEDFDIDKYYQTSRTISVDVNANNMVKMMESKYRRTPVTHLLPDDPDHVLIPRHRYRKYLLHKANVYTGKSELWIKGGNHTWKVFTDGVGNPLFRLDYLRIAREIHVLKYVGDDDWEKIEQINLEKEEEENIETEGLFLFALTNESSLVYRRRNEETGFYEIQEWSRDGKSRKVVSKTPDRDVLSAIVDRRSNTMMGYITEKDVERRHYFDEKQQQIYDDLISQIGNNNVRFSVPSDEKGKAVVFVQGRDLPGLFGLYDIHAKKFSPLQFRHAKLPQEKLGIPAVVNVKSGDGTKIRTYILFPPGFEEGKPAPMVVMPHGGPHARDRATFDNFAQFIATRGYVVVQPNFRGSSGYGLSFEEAGYKEWGGLMQDDVTDVTKFMIKQGYADPAKVCIVGGSYGGYAALMGAVKTPDLFQCSVSINGVTHLKNMIKYDIRSTGGKYQDRIEKELHKKVGHPKLDSAMLNQNSPALRASDVKIPILLVAGEEDKVVRINQSKLMYKALRKAKKDVEFMKLDSASHNVFYYRDNAEKVYKKIEEFLAAYLN